MKVKMMTETKIKLNLKHVEMQFYALIFHFDLKFSEILLHSLIFYLKIKKCTFSIISTLFNFFKLFLLQVPCDLKKRGVKQLLAGYL